MMRETSVVNGLGPQSFPCGHMVAPGFFALGKAYSPGGSFYTPKFLNFEVVKAIFFFYGHFCSIWKFLGWGGQPEAATTSLHCSHGNGESELCLRPHTTACGNAGYLTH